MENISGTVVSIAHFMEYADAPMIMKAISIPIAGGPVTDSAR